MACMYCVVERYHEEYCETEREVGKNGEKSST